MKLPRILLTPDDVSDPELKAALKIAGAMQIEIGHARHLLASVKKRWDRVQDRHPHVPDLPDAAPATVLFACYDWDAVTKGNGPSVNKEAFDAGYAECLNRFTS